jgi:hypothetical protein
LWTGFVVAFTVAFEVGLAAGFDVEVPVDVVCPSTGNTAIKQMIIVAVAIRFMTGLSRDNLTATCRPMRALAAAPLRMFGGDVRTVECDAE